MTSKQRGSDIDSDTVTHVQFRFQFLKSRKMAFGPDCYPSFKLKRAELKTNHLIFP